MVSVIADDVVVLAAHHGEHTLIDREARREAEGLVFADIFSQFLLELHMQVERSVEESAAGTARAVFVESSLGGIDDTLVGSKACIGVRTEHQHLVTAHLNLSTLLARDGTEIGVYIVFHELLRHTVALEFLF